MKRTSEFKAVVIGAGQGGVPLAMALAKSGWKTALIEARHVGGTCVNEGCTPTKTMVASARVAYLVRRASDYGVKTGSLAIDMKRVRKRKRDIVQMFRSGSEKRVENTENLELIRGKASFTGARALVKLEGLALEVKLEGKDKLALSAEYVFINTGAKPAKPRIEGIDRVPYLDSTTVMELDTVPEHLVVIGGGYIGLEFSQMFARFGSKVTIVQRASQLLSREDEDVAQEVLAILRQDGVDVLLNTLPSRVDVDSGGIIGLTVKGEGEEETLRGSHLLVAAGRTPATETLNLQAAGVETDERGFIKVDEGLQTTTPNVFAMGDVKGGPAFTHISYDDFRILRTNLLDGGEASVRDRIVPYTVFIDPQLGRVGMSEREAEKSGKKVRVAKLPMSYVARALEMDETRGFMKAIVDAETDRILGCAVLGIEGGEIMSAIQLAMMGDLPFTTLRDAVFAHPTLAESFNNLFVSLTG